MQKMLYNKFKVCCKDNYLSVCSYKKMRIVEMESIK